MTAVCIGSLVILLAVLFVWLILSPVEELAQEVGWQPSREWIEEAADFDNVHALGDMPAEWKDLNWKRIGE